MAATIRDVARKAGVAVGTVSRYLNGYNLQDENRLKVEQAIRELGFKENIMAKGLKNNRSMTIGVVIGSLTDVFSTSIVTAVEKTVEKENYSIILCNYEGDAKRIDQKLEFLYDRSVDGIIIFPGSRYEKTIGRYLSRKVPMVLINEDIPSLEVDKVLVDNANASFRAVEKLILLKHRRIAVINGPDTACVARERFKGYLDAMSIYDIKVDESIVKYGNFTNIGGYNAARELLESSNPPTALYVTNYYMTLGAVMAINQLKVKVPEQLSVIGFDRFELTDVIEPALTVIEQPTEKIGEEAAKLLLKRISGNYADFPECCRISTRMVLRNSMKELQCSEL